MAIEVAHRGHVAVITIARPEVLNAIDEETTRDLSGVFDSLEDDPSTWVVVLTGHGDRAFCAGADLKAMARMRAAGVRLPRRPRGGFAGIVRRDFRKPLVAAVNGLALGGGFEIVLSCDLAVADERAVFGLPEVTRGIIAAAGGAIRLSQRVPLAVAQEIALTGTPIGAQRAASLGLVNLVVPAGQALSEALVVADRIAANAPLAVQVTKRLLRASVTADEDQLWQLQAALTDGLLASDDATEGVRAFGEKRAPVWRGR